MYLLKTWFNNGSDAWVIIPFIVAAVIAGIVRITRVERSGQHWYKDKRVYFYFGIALAIFLFVRFFITPDYR